METKTHCKVSNDQNHYSRHSTTALNFIFKYRSSPKIEPTENVF